MADYDSSHQKQEQETFTPKEPSKVLQRIVSISFLVLLALNIYCIHTVKRTLISFTDFLNYNLFFSIPFMIFAFYMAVRSAEHGTKKLPQQIFTAVAAGYVLFFICGSCIPYGYNYYWSGVGEEHRVSDFEVWEETTENEDLDVTTITYEYVFEYDGYSFDFSESEYYQGSYIVFNVAEGPLGFRVFKDWKVRY